MELQFKISLSYGSHIICVDIVSCDKGLFVFSLYIFWWTIEAPDQLFRIVEWDSSGAFIPLHVRLLDAFLHTGPGLVIISAG